MGHKGARTAVSLIAILALGAAIRLIGIGWGLPPITPQVIASDFRCSYAFDEDDALSGVAKAQPSKLDFDPRIYDWGTFHLELLLLTLEGCERAGVFAHLWRDAYYNMRADFDAVYITGRCLTVAMSLLSMVAVFLLGRELGSPETGLWAAALLAVSPNHVLQSDQIRVDITMTTLVTVAVVLAMRISQGPRTGLLAVFGAVCALAITAKYSSALIILTVAGLTLWRSRAGWMAFIAGGLMGAVAGQPYFFVKPVAMADSIGAALSGHRFESIASLLLDHAGDIARFSLGPPACALALAGAWLLWRRGAWKDRLVIAVLAAAVVTLFLERFRLLRYHLFALPFLACAAGLALTRLDRGWRFPLGAVALLFPLFGSIGQIDFMRAVPPANRMLDYVERNVPAGAAISRAPREMPPLDLRTYPMHGNPNVDDLSTDPPAWVLMTNLADRIPDSITVFLRTRYEPVSRFEDVRRFAWATLGEFDAPNDWKYTHPVMTLYRLRPQ